jgi:bleomycin hydrolase
MDTLTRGALALDDIAGYSSAFQADPKNRLALNAVTKTSITAVAANREAVVRANHTFSHLLKAGAATSQNSSGRCWMFAALNTFRLAAANQMNLEDFEFSQSYLMFWDKLEKANYFLESILRTLQEPGDGRLIAWLMSCPLQDGGQWDMFVNLVRKYGLVPKTAMPESESSSSSRWMNEHVTHKLRECAWRLRSAYEARTPFDALLDQKAAMLEEIYRMLAIHLGEPPREFLWQWRDKENEFHRDGVITPHEFMRKHVPVDLDEMVCLIHCPQAAKEYNTLYTIDYLGNVVGGDPVRYLNVEMDVLKQAAVAQIVDGSPVWFGCDVGKMLDRDLGVMDLDLFDLGLVYGTDFQMDKAARLDYGQSLMTHAMVFTGVDLDSPGRPTKWRVENSWGDKGGDKGFMVMTDPWFDEYMYEVVVDRKYLAPELLAVLETEPVHLPPWDPMGSLAVAV